MSDAAAPVLRADLVDGLDAQHAGERMHALARRLFPIQRSITGEGVRTTLRIIGELIPLTLHEVPTGTVAFDWEVPREWNLREAWIADHRGSRVIDVRNSTLHVVSYSVPVKRRMSLKELRPHLHALPDHPDWIPYRTTYYSDDWGFCLSQRQLDALAEGDYDVCIDASLAPGSLTYGECVLPGQTTDEVLISSHVCHPSLANDNLSGIALATALAERLAAVDHMYTYRFVFAPVTIGAITWLSRNERHLERIRHGLVLTCAGDAGSVTYKKSRRGDCDIDRAVAHVLRHSGAAHRIDEFLPYGYDERQYCSPAFDLPVGCFMRTPNGRYPEYHTSADDLTFLRADALSDSLTKCLAVIDVLENDRRFINLNPKCEPQLGKRGLYKAMGGHAQVQELQLALLWVLNQSDGRRGLLDIAERAQLPFGLIKRAAWMLLDHNLLQPC